MSILYIGYPTAPEMKQENGLNSVLVLAASVAAAKSAAIAAKVNGSTNDTTLNSWSYSQLADPGDATLPNGSTVMWLTGVHGLGAGRSI